MFVLCFVLTRSFGLSYFLFHCFVFCWFCFILSHCFVLFSFVCCFVFMLFWIAFLSFL